MSNQQEFRFQISTNLYFGVNESLKLADIIKSLKFGKVAIIIDQGVKDHPQVKSCIKMVQDTEMLIKIFVNESVEPDYDYLDLFTEQVKKGEFDVLVAIGGGSTLDLAKGVATLYKNPGPGLDYRGFPDLKENPLPIIAIPTTAGTASEVTFNAVFTDNKQKKKLGINSTLNFPKCAVIDPILTKDAPKSVTVSSGADALVHTLESFAHKNHTPISRMFSMKAFELLFNNLRKVLDHPDNLDIRGNIALGAYLAGVALINSGSGPSGAFSYPLGAVYKVPHGYAGAMFLSSITKINVKKGYKDYALLYDLIDGVIKDISVDEKNDKFTQLIEDLMNKLEVPRSLSAYKLGTEDIDFMIDQYDILKEAIAQNPIEITKEDIRDMMKKLA